MMKKKQLLQGHKRVGKKFIPPLKQLPGMREMSYIDDLLPELIWLGLVNDRLGFVGGARVFEGVATAAHEAAKGGGPRTNYALLSAYRSFDQDQKESFINSLAQLSILAPLRDYIAPLNLLYDECPLRFLGPPDVVKSEQALIATISSCVERHINKYDTPGVVLNGMMLLYKLVTKTIKFTSNVTVPDFNAVIEKPESEEAKRAAGFMRATALAELGMLTIDKSWSQYFWNRGYELSPCEFEDLTDER